MAEDLTRQKMTAKALRGVLPPTKRDVTGVNIEKKIEEELTSENIGKVLDVFDQWNAKGADSPLSVTYAPERYVKERYPELTAKRGTPEEQAYYYKGVDPEGRPIRSMYHAGTSLEGRNLPLSDYDAARLAHLLTSTHYSPRGGREAVGSLFGMNKNRGKGTYGITYGPAVVKGNELMGMHALPPNVMPGVLHHELGHLIHMRSGEPDLRFDPSAGPQIKKAGVNTRAASDAREKSYIESSPEVTAESLRQYMTDPNGFKARYPEAAARLRKMVNENPDLNKLFTLSRADALRRYEAPIG